MILRKIKMKFKRLYPMYRQFRFTPSSTASVNRRKSWPEVGPGPCLHCSLSVRPGGCPACKSLLVMDVPQFCSDRGERE